MTTSPQPTLRNLLIRLWRHLSKRRKRQLGLLLLLMLITAFFELVNVGALLPFIAALAAPDMFFNNPTFRSVADVLGITSPNQLILPLAAVFVLASIVTGALRLLSLWANTELSNAIGADLSIEAYRRTLYQPYRIHVAHSSSELMSGIGKTGNAVVVLQGLLTVISSTFILVALILGLVAIDPFVVLLTMFFFGVSYGMITWVARRRLQVNSQRIATESTLVIKALQEGFGGIRDVLLNGTQQVYCDIYRSADLLVRRASASNIFISASPRFAMETIGMGVLAGLACYLNAGSGGFATSLPFLGAFLLGAQRLLPALQQIYGSWVSLVGNQASLSHALELLELPLPADALSPAPPPLQFKGSIEFSGVRFRYLDDGPWVIDGLDLTIPKGARVGLVGSTGSGKSTTADLLMGLLEPTEGKILVDGLSICCERRRAWQSTIAHVPQSLFLADTTLAENIALGIPKNDIDMKLVRVAARQAQIADFIENRREGYNAFVGERGIRISGGQRQRIGIARALYKQASVLVFDEATSSLDNTTEQAVIESIEKLNRDLTILLIAHRLTTVQRCDQIIELCDGKVVAQGTYEELLERSPSFKRMALAVA